MPTLGARVPISNKALKAILDKPDPGEAIISGYILKIVALHLGLYFEPLNGSSVTESGSP